MKNKRRHSLRALAQGNGSQQNGRDRRTGDDQAVELSLAERLVRLRREFEESVREAPPSLEHENRSLFLLVAVAEELYAYPVEFAQEILTPPTIVPVPDTPPAVLGIINYRGEIRTVVSLRRVFGLEEAATSPTAESTGSFQTRPEKTRRAPHSRSLSAQRLIVAKGLKFPTCFLVDSLFKVEEINQKRVQPLPATVNGRRAFFLNGQLVLHDRVAFLLQPLRLCESELVCASSVQTAAFSRACSSPTTETCSPIFPPG